MTGAGDQFRRAHHGDLSGELRKCRSWKIRGYGDSASFSAWGEREDRRAVASIHVRCRRGETIEAMVWRGLAELHRRWWQGMPAPNRKAALRRKLLAKATRAFRDHQFSGRPN